MAPHPSDLASVGMLARLLWAFFAMGGAGLTLWIIIERLGK